MSESLSAAEAGLAIRAQVSPVDPDSCRFSVGRPVHGGEGCFFPDRDSALGQPLAERLFQISGVASVLVSGNVVTVGKAADARWNELLRPVGAAIRGQLLSGVPCILPGLRREVKGARSEEELQKEIQQVMDREINPGIASHGGRIAVDKVKQGALYLRMSGGCQGCAASKVTLRQGVEVVVRRTFPEIKDIVDVTDHASGASPYYVPN
jgi:NFU1 iron-sulfur cluster scaffold homolog, mitochondrial